MHKIKSLINGSNHSIYLWCLQKFLLWNCLPVAPFGALLPRQWCVGSSVLQNQKLCQLRTQNLNFFWGVELFFFIPTVFLLPFAMPLLSPALKASVRDWRQDVERELNSFWTIKRCWESDKLIEIFAVSLDFFCIAFMFLCRTIHF